MPHINPKILKKLRETQNMTLERLKDESGVPIGTINKIERGRRNNVRLNTIQRLAHALKVNVEVLEGSASPDDASLQKLNLSNLNKSELSVIIDDRCRNALQLVARRYGFPSDEIINLAPFLFFWAAEKSLQSRKEALNQIEDKFQELNSIVNSNFPHATFEIERDMVSEAIISRETQSIKFLDLFGRIEEDDPSDDSLGYSRAGYEESEDNPFTVFLKSMASELSGQAEFEWMYSTGSPHYEICRDDALKLVGGDEEATEAILSGRAPLHLRPKESPARNVLFEGGAQRTAEWAKAEAKKHPGLNLDDLDL